MNLLRFMKYMKAQIHRGRHGTRIRGKCMSAINVFNNSFLFGNQIRILQTFHLKIPIWIEITGE
jgi:hypothetical protein